MEEENVVQSLAALAHGMRLQVFRLLVVAGRTGLTPGAIVEQIEVPAATLSFHLKELVNAGLVTQERDRRYLIYRVAFERMNALLGYLTANCCQGEACAPAGRTSCSTC
jgi:ArsR family transcriptional regulator, arsenate/arsenite/antimonite-responsive transcriptional repressor